MTLNTNTGMSVGLAVLIVGATIWIVQGQSEQKREITSMKNELSMQALATKSEISADIKDLKNRMSNLEASKSSWTSTDMFRWAVHLQQLNKDPKKLQTEGLIVPEPEVDKK